MAESMLCKWAGIACEMGAFGQTLDTLALAALAIVAWALGVMFGCDGDGLWDSADGDGGD